MRFLRLFNVARSWRKFVAAFHMMRSSRVPLRLKLIAGAIALLIISPLNILGDIPLLGMVDDVALLSILAGWFVTTAGRHDAVTTVEGGLVSSVR